MLNTLISFWIKFLLSLLHFFYCLVFNLFPCIYLWVYLVYLYVYVLISKAFCADLPWNGTDITSPITPRKSSLSYSGQITLFTGFSFREFQGHFQMEASTCEVIFSPTIFSNPNPIFFQHALWSRMLVLITFLHCPVQGAGCFPCPSKPEYHSASWRRSARLLLTHLHSTREQNIAISKCYDRIKFWQVTTWFSLPVLLVWQIDS